MQEKEEHIPEWVEELNASLNKLDEQITNIKAIDTISEVKEKVSKLPQPATAAEIAAVINKIM